MTRMMSRGASASVLCAAALLLSHTLTHAAPSSGEQNAGASRVTAKYGEVQMLVTGSARATGAGAAPVSRATAAYPGAISARVSAHAGQHLHILFDVTDAASGDAFAPHQVFLRFTPKTGAAAPSYFVAQADAASLADKRGVYKASLDVSDRAALVGIADGGAFDVDVIVGDARLANPVVWRVGSVELSPPAAPAKPAPALYTTPLLHESDTATAPLKEIQHAFRQPESRPPAVVSLAATAVVLGALAVWVLSALRSASGWRLPPGAAVVDALVFHSGFASILLLFAAYWFNMFGLNMFLAVGYALILSIPTAFFGRRLLVALQAEDVAKLKSE